MKYNIDNNELEENKNLAELRESSFRWVNSSRRASEGLASSIFSNAAGLIQTLADSIHHNNAPISNLSQIIIKGNRKS